MSESAAEQTTAMAAAQSAAFDKSSKHPNTRNSRNGNDVDKLKEENANLHQQLSAALRNCDQASLQASQQQKDHQNTARILDALRHDFAKLNTAYLKIQDRAHTMDSRLAMRDNRHNQAEEDNRLNMQSLVAENDVLVQKLKQNEAYMDQFLQNAMKDGRWNPLPDDTLRDRLSRLHSDTRHWAKRWCCDSLSFSHLSKEQVNNCMKFFAEFVRCKPDGSLPAAVESPSIKVKGKITQLLLTGAVAHLLVAEIFSKPFFCMEPSQADVMREIYGDLLKANFQQAHVWRSTVWRILNPPQTATSSEQDKQVAQATTKLMYDLCDKIKVEFLTSPASVLFNSVGDAEQTERMESLRNLLVTATEITTSIWTQRSYLDYMTMSAFIENKVSFNPASPLMNGHPLNRIDPEDPVHNGREILIVTQPTILAFDDNDDLALKGDRFRVLSRAIIWLDDTKKGGLYRRDTS